ncbi:unnamed protein product [Nesidiocoris tenuis]|uniref:Uncharacterized protein n=1 Tax=Nesidiocoris tenuis TaxID=355587 RepID=A0A6H5GFQ0_9HEMI|nr:unnamed protein product [Nesidiocoris tenuis]
MLPAIRHESIHTDEPSYIYQELFKRYFTMHLTQKSRFLRCNTFLAGGTYRRRSGEISYLHFVKTATIPMVPYVTTLNFHDVSNVHVQVRNWRYEISPLRRRYVQ